MNDADAAKRAAAEAAVALVEDGMRIGLGTGSTMRHAVAALGRRVAAGLRVTGIPTSVATEQQARGLGIALGDFATIERLDLAIDGADEVERGTLRLIKGLGGALLREKIVAEAAGRFVILADASKVVANLGARAPLPVEITPFGHEQTARRIADLGGAPVLRLRDGVPFVSDGGNLILDCAGFAPIRDPQTLQLRLRAIAGVMETGLFLLQVEQAIIGAPDGSVEVLRPG
ncbi:MAG TPA: ribose-5-phosphate isomerase RpiA [Acetobacteraceae bacterium]|jgi:ribose 5-phosphate isomerase A|nr:ribose-5-phosphate isomerase RpiA [Acetobacteraceae bacterium]